jgi:hypothetical protein
MPQLAQSVGDDLPGQSELIRQPAALLLPTAFGKLFPQGIHFLLGLTVHEEGDGRREFEMRAAVQGKEFMEKGSTLFEFDAQQFPHFLENHMR